MDGAPVPVAQFLTNIPSMRHCYKWGGCFNVTSVSPLVICKYYVQSYQYEGATTSRRLPHSTALVLPQPSLPGSHLSSPHCI